ncbi:MULTISPECIES: esterase/lipase family protein [Shewanella]|uniref:Alpha/beta hydrolase n=1 Tax=Shewanella marisflavi TaxID=260364 RepID=A0ABX5WMI2_9GAMM|nr:MULTISPECIES: alpha/beta fold hydrolase [Shewanella]QDF75767.1 alpha/beta hydrolase [Shewanella marisflavi]
MTSNSESVVLLHGLARTRGSMEKMAAALSVLGYHCVNLSYPSTRFDIQTLAAEHIDKALKACRGDKIHFVTHSMGGILVRQYLSLNPLPALGRVVMLGPPNQGSEVVDSLKHFPGFKWINGPAGMQLGTERDSVPNSLGPANFELGVIAGTRSINLLLSTLLPAPNDGKVSVANTKLDGMRDHIILPVTHPFMMNSGAVIAQTVHFLAHGRFSHEA